MRSWFWNKQMGPWRIWGLWWKRRVFVGLLAVAEEVQDA
jgi:hypothetical protein